MGESRNGEAPKYKRGFLEILSAMRVLPSDQDLDVMAESMRAFKWLLVVGDFAFDDVVRW